MTDALSRVFEDANPDCPRWLHPLEPVGDPPDLYRVYSCGVTPVEAGAE